MMDGRPPTASQPDGRATPNQLCATASTAGMPDGPSMPPKHQRRQAIASKHKLGDVPMSIASENDLATAPIVNEPNGLVPATIANEPNELVPASHREQPRAGAQG